MFSSTLVKSAIVFSSLVSLVSAHGFVVDVTLDGKVYKGDRPFTEGGSKNPKANNPIRSIRNNGPAVPAAGKMANSAAMACGRDQVKSIFTAPVTAGSKVTIDWGNWPHDSGPVITYLGACQGDCATTDPTKVNFFKIHEVAFEPGTTKWVQETVLKARKPFTFTLPKNVPSGNFLMRHEIIALHLAPKKDGAEFYPTCIQVNIKGGTGKIPSQTVKFPGGYKNTDAGILFNIFNGNANLKKYKIPGPPIALGGTVTTSAVDSTTTTDETTEDETTTGDNTEDGTTGGDDTEEEGDSGVDTGDDEEDTTGDETTDDNEDTDDGGCGGSDDVEEEEDASVTEEVPTQTSKSAKATSTGKKNSYGGKKHGHGKNRTNSKGKGHKHSRSVVVSDESPLGAGRMMKRSRVHLALDLANAASA